MNNKEIFLHLCRFLSRTRSSNIRFEFSSSCLSIYRNNIFDSKIKYDEITDKITYWEINTPNITQYITQYIDLDNYRFLFRIIDISYENFKNLKKFFNLLVNCNFI